MKKYDVKTVASEENVCAITDIGGRGLYELSVVGCNCKLNCQLPVERFQGWLEFAGVENDGLEIDGVEQEQTYILHPMKNFNVYDM